MGWWQQRELVKRTTTLAFMRNEYAEKSCCARIYEHSEMPATNALAWCLGGGGIEMEDVHGHSKGSFDATQGYFHWQVFDKMTTVIYVCAIPQVCVLYLLSEAKIWLQKFRKDFSLTQNIWHQSLCLELKRKSKQKKWFSKWRLVYISKLCF